MRKDASLPSTMSEKIQRIESGENIPIPSSAQESNVDFKSALTVDEEALSDEDARPPHDTVKIPWTYKLFALVCIVAFPIGTNWTSASLGPLKNTLRTELDITNTQFGVIPSSDAVVNSIWPIVAGICLDWFGPNIITLLSTSVIFVGSILVALGVTFGAWRLLVVRNVIMGFGIAVVDSAQQKFFYH